MWCLEKIILMFILSKKIEFSAFATEKYKPKIK